MHQMAGGGVDWKAIREDFPILREQAHGHPLIYFDNAATSQKPRAVLDALRNYYEHDNANVHRGLHELSSRATEAYENSRQHVAKYLGAASSRRDHLHPRDDRKHQSGGAGVGREISSRG